MRLLRTIALILTAATTGMPSSSAQEPADRLVRDTAPLSPSQEAAAFRVAEGFEVHLFAGEEQLGGKPVNMAFDHRGRLWVSSTREYPFAVPPARWTDKGLRAQGSQDSIRILEDIDGDGRADKATVFANDLNIPTGVLPYGDGCIAWSIPNIVYLRDTDGDGICDQRKILFGPLGYEKDTHGMISSLRLGLDGWVYATHGFSNTSHFKAGDGSTLDLTSGNVFRFRPDGSRVEIWTKGQVNPFGLCWDSWGNLYSADCHSSPIYQLLRGACYPSFGKPDDGLGFAPVMCEHAHGSTGIAGIVFLDGGVWGPEWDDQILVGNPVTSRINQDQVVHNGSTPAAREQPDFLSSQDPWFRPVDLQLGPDSALYVADFYNRIIGHYEVPLDHPGRDREKGRIWRISRKGFSRSLTEAHVSQKTPAELLELLGAPNLTLRNQALEALLMVLGMAQGEQRSALESSISAAMQKEGPDSQRRRAMGSWLTQRGALASSLPAAKGPLEQVHQIRATIAGTDPVLLEGSPDPRVLAAFLEKAHELDEARALDWFTSLRGRLPVEDARLHYSWRLALRSAMAGTSDWSRLPAPGKDPGAEADLRRIAATIPSQASALWMLERLRAIAPAGGMKALGDLPPLLLHLSRHLPEETLQSFIELVRQIAGGDLGAQAQLFTSLHEGQRAGKKKLNPASAKWAAEIIQGLVQALDQSQNPGWEDLPAPAGTTPGTRPWLRQQRACADGTQRWFLSSLPPGGEKLTGGVRTPAFDIPDVLTFWMAGHSGPPKSFAHAKNQVRLVDAANGEVLARTFPPRNDVAQVVTWSFQHQKVDPKKPLANHRAYLEIVDGDDGSAFAWLAVGGFESPLPPLPENDARAREARVMALARMTLLVEAPEAVLKLASLPAKEDFTAETRYFLASALAQDRTGLAALAPLAQEPDLAAMIFDLLVPDADLGKVLREGFSTRPHRAQVKLASAMAASAGTAPQLLDLAPPRVLADPMVTGKIQALKDAALSARLSKLTDSLPPENEAVAALLSQRLNAFAGAKTDSRRGEQLFALQCAVCHRIGVRGNLVGPQLDGVGTRGPERLLEDILDPNRAVDPAFRLHFVKKADGSLLAGLLRREQDGELTFADAAGQEHTVKKRDITDTQESPFSLMPAGFGEILPEQDLLDLLGYLLERK